MIRSRLAAGALAALGLSACATAEKFNARMNGFIGQPQAAVVARYGLPEATMQLPGGETIMQYTRGGTMVVPGVTTYQPVVSNTTGTITTPRPIGPGVVGQTTSQFDARTVTYQAQQSPATHLQMWCTVQFTVNAAGIVRSWSAQGNHCVAE